MSDGVVERAGPVEGSGGDAGCSRGLPHPAPADLEVTEVLAALADPARLAIVAELSTAPPPGLACEAVGGALGRGVPRSTRSHQLKVLREAGVVRTTPAGRHRLVTLRRDDLEQRFPGLLEAVLRGAARGGGGSAAG